ncbi:MAG: signal recognition particle-docking protein FtsY [Phycisphaerales bacterium]|nr:signal recognition particle-docking protein FtsY [Phycisphaerales bacterium]
MAFRLALDLVKRSLSKTAKMLGGGLRSMLHGRVLDDATITQIEERLIAADVGVHAAREITAALRAEFRSGRVERGEDAIEFLKRSLKARWGAASIALARSPMGPTVFLVAGVNGAGKTTSIAKIARELRGQGRTVLLAAADTFRAGAVEQLSIWGSRLGVEVVRGAAGGDPAAVAFDAAQAAVKRGVDVLLVDTAGRLHNQENLMRELTKIKSVVSRCIPGAPHETLLVVDATAGQNALVQARMFAAAIEVTGIFLAKIDGTAKGGIVVAIQDELKIPVKLLGTGETPEDVQPFDPDSFIEAMFAE